AGLFQGFLFLAELARMEHLYSMPAAAALSDLAPHEAERQNGRIILVLGIGGAEFTRKRARGAGRHQQRDNNNHRPLKLGAAKQFQSTHPLGDGVYGGRKRFNTFLAEAGPLWLSRRDFA